MAAARTLGRGKRDQAVTKASERPSEIAVAIIGFLSKAFKEALLARTVEDHYAEIIGSTEIDKRRQTVE